MSSPLCRARLRRLCSRKESAGGLRPAAVRVRDDMITTVIYKFDIMYIYILCTYIQFIFTLF